MNDENPFRAALEWFGPNGERWRKASMTADWGPDEGCALVPLPAGVGAMDLLGDLLREMYPKRYDKSIGFWNDHPDTTFDDIRTVFEKAAVRWDERL